MCVQTFVKVHIPLDTLLYDAAIYDDEIHVSIQNWQCLGFYVNVSGNKSCY